MNINCDQEKDIRNKDTDDRCLSATHHKTPSINYDNKGEDPNYLVQQNVLYEASPLNSKPEITGEKEQFNDRPFRQAHRKPLSKHEPDYHVLEGPDPNAAYESVSNVNSSSPVYDVLVGHGELIPQKEPFSLYNVLKHSSENFQSQHKKE